MLTIELNMYHAVALGAFLFWLGGVITDKVSLLSRYCIPAPLVGGLCFSILNCILYSMGIASINFDSPRFVKGFMLLLLAVGIGNQISVWLTALTGLTFPAYIGAMLVAVAVRNVMDGVHVSYPAEEIDTMGNMFLSIFLAMALAGLKLWELIDLAMPMVICLVL